MEIKDFYENTFKWKYKKGKEIQCKSLRSDSRPKSAFKREQRVRNFISISKRNEIKLMRK